MNDITNKNFGYIIAYILPGLIGVWGTSFKFKFVQDWFTGAEKGMPSLGGFLFILLLSLTLGLFISVIRWLVIDNLHWLMGIKSFKLDFSKLDEKYSALQLIIDNHYQYNQFYSNSIIAIIYAHSIFIYIH